MKFYGKRKIFMNHHQVQHNYELNNQELHNQEYFRPSFGYKFQEQQYTKVANFPIKQNINNYNYLLR